ncbi:hypothetical protein BH24GEM3_BH24GEM3_14500 [soil metagenome]|jgi:hypothetical protein
MKIRPYILALALLAAPAPLLAQGSPDAARQQPRMIRETMEQRSPLASLLRDREALGLTAAQVTRLEAIQQRMIERNRPLVQRLLEMRRSLGESPRGRTQEMTPEQRQRWQRHVEQARPIMKQIHENNRQAMEEVGSVLTPAQRAQVRERIEAKHGAKRDHSGGHEHGKRGERRDTSRGRPN